MNERYLSVDQVAEILGTTVRFPRRLVAERRIPYVKVGTHVRIAESVVREYIAANTVDAVRAKSRRSRYRRAA
ncbi:excisionase family DNA-binding protein [Streptomyces antimicrobicus]|uniref:Excisionase family DNA-binding protein n=1 Tax=Streptomyces antimicrobicus TaxID=2883108 RepID=A0ABS8B6M5_9ACTN|nr:excisionase family DNA-binding protein [Streptomyces antimicrobicus]MCB5180268.1 excisionase family DNA-binding protein [Streptomyces antimicrobicus]